MSERYGIVAFDLAAPLPSGTIVLEASAGTGKTHAIASLAVRQIAEGLPIDTMLLVTFSRMATAELRERTRSRLVAVASALREPGADSNDDVVVALRTGPHEDVALRRRRLEIAVSDFDAATVSTTHTFCSRMLEALGVAGERDEGVTLVENLDDLTAEVAVDVYLRWYSGSVPAPFGFDEAVEIAKAVVRQPTAEVVPRIASRTDADGRTPGDRASNDPDSEAGHRVRFVRAVSREVRRRTRRSRVRSYDELQSTLLAAVSDPEFGEQARRRIRQRFRVVLVDEFQDTDPVQWQILRLCFHGHCTLLLVGDPKQSIYKFRGAEVLSYLDAARIADTTRVLATNRRADECLVHALNHLMGGAHLGHPEIVVRNVTAAHARPSLPDHPALRIRHMRRRGPWPLGQKGFPAVGDLRTAVIDDVAADIAATLAQAPTICDRDGWVRPLRAADVVVLLHRRATIEPLQRALRQHGVASVVGAGASVFASAGARDWFHVLRALEQPARTERIVLAALTPIVGRTSADLDGPGDAVGEVSDLFAELADTLRDSGFSAMYQQLRVRTDLERRILSAVDGERVMTDIGHLAALCARYTSTEAVGPNSLLRWFADRLDDPRIGDQDEQSRRLDRDAQAVGIMTVHASKGLEFPVVYVPFGWDGSRMPYRPTLDLHDDAGRRIIDVRSSSDPSRRANERTAELEDAGEALRLFYVAVTRARSQVVLWWAPSHATDRSPLNRFLFGRDATGSPDPLPTGPVPSDAEIGEAFAAWASRTDAAITTEAMDPFAASASAADIAQPTHARPLSARVIDRTIDTAWRRTSYSAIVADQHGTSAVEPESRVTDDEPESVGDSTDPTTTEPVPASLPSLMNALPSGAAFGTVVHAVFETVTPETGSDGVALSTAVVDACRRVVARSGMSMPVSTLATAVEAAMRTPLRLATSDDLADVDLAAIPARDRLAEMEFELPLDGERSVTVTAIAELLRRHLAPDDPMVDYHRRLREVGDTVLYGYLTGSIDAVLRVDGRFVVVDYKTNRLGRGDLDVAQYGSAAMAAEMMRSHYPLQAVLYVVALHRYLRWRLPGYDPSRHVGPVRYLFVRGMVGAATPSDHGVFAWHVPPALIEAVSDLLAGMR